MYEGIDTIALDAELAYQDIVPLAWRPLTTPLSSESINQLNERNLRLLQAFAALDEQGQVDKPDDNSPHAADILRLDMKINLLLDLVGRILIANQPRPNSSRIRFNAHSATWKTTASSPTPRIGDEGVLEIYLKDCLVEPLCLLGSVTDVASDGWIKLKLHSAGEAVADLIEKLVFRRHRRQVADSRQPRSGDTARTGKFRR